MASVTITTTGAEDARLAPAFGVELGLPGSANAAQVKGALVAYMRNVVLIYERKVAADSAVAAVTTINPT